MICWGENRVVLLIGRWAVKLPRLHQGWRSLYYGCLNNLNEAHYSGRDGACPVVLSLPGGFATVMRRARPLTAPEWAEVDVDAFRKRGPLSVEAKADSFGILGDRLVAVDYGWPGGLEW